MNYLQFEIGGKKRGFKFGLKVIGDCIRHSDQDPVAFMGSITKNRFESIPVILYYAHKYNEEKKGEIIDFTLFDVYDWVEEEGLMNEKLDDVTKFFIKSLYDNVPTMKEELDKEGNEELKKSLIGT